MATLVLRAGNSERPAIQNEAQRLTLARGQVVRIDDVLSLFPDISPPAASFYLWVGVESDQAIVTSRTFTASPGGAAGTLGQGIQAVELSDLPPAGTSHVVPLSPDNDRVRSNIGVVNADETETGFVLRIRSETGEILGELSFDLPAASWSQFNGVFASLGLTPVDRAYAEVMTTAAGGHAGTALFAVYSSLVDNSTGDASTVLAKRLQ